MRPLSESRLVTEAVGERETEDLAARLVETAVSGEVYGLVGPLGAGKTVFVRGAVRGLGGDPAQVRSPTFTLMNLYAARIPVSHFDLYRLAAESDLDGIGFDEFARGDGVTFVEWADRFREVADAADVLVRIEFGDGPDERRITVIRRHFATG